MGKPDGKRPFGRLMDRWSDAIKTPLLRNEVWEYKLNLSYRRRIQVARSMDRVVKHQVHNGRGIMTSRQTNFASCEVPRRCGWGVCSRMRRCVTGYLGPDVPRQRSGLTCKERSVQEKKKTFFLDISVLENETATSSSNVWNQKPTTKASHPRRTDTSAVSFSRDFTPLSLNSSYLFWFICTDCQRKFLSAQAATLTQLTQTA